MSDWATIARLRARRLVAHHGLRVVAAFLLVAVAALALSAVLFAAPPTIDSTAEETTTLVETESHTSALVTGETTLYEKGTELEDRSVYLRTAAPNLTVRVDATPPDGEAVLDQELALVYRAERNGEEVWSETDPIATNRTETNGTATVAETVDISRIQRRVDEVSSEIGGAAAVRVSLQHELTYRTDDHEGTQVTTARMLLTRDVYGLNDGLDDVVRETETTSVERADPDRTTIVTVADRNVVVPTTAAWLLVVVLITVGGAGLAAREHRRDRDPDALERQLERARFEDWISTGSVDVGGVEAHSAVDSLADLVDVAIDSNRRVIHDATTDRYVVVDDGVVYTFSRGVSGTDSIELNGPDVEGTGVAGDEPTQSETTRGDNLVGATADAGDTNAADSLADGGLDVGAGNGTDFDGGDGTDPDADVDAADPTEQFLRGGIDGADDPDGSVDGEPNDAVARRESGDRGPTAGTGSPVDETSRQLDGDGSESSDDEDPFFFPGRDE